MNFSQPSPVAPPKPSPDPVTLIAPSVRHNGLEAYVTPVRSYSHEALNRWRELAGGRPIDFIFIDGSHEYAAILRDFEMAMPLVKPGGWIAFHDVVETLPGPLRVWREHAAPVLQSHEFCGTLACGRKLTSQVFPMQHVVNPNDWGAASDPVDVSAAPGPVELPTPVSYQ